MVRGSTPKFSIGIYGDWGTGKTTLMRMVEKKLNTFVKEEEFFWDDLANNSSGLKSFLKEYYKVDWIENSQFENDKGHKTIRIYGANKVRETDERGTYFDKSIHSLSLSLNDEKNKATFVIDGKEIRQFNVKRVNNKSKIYLQENEILTVWFNAWRYEREDQFALIALMKTIAYAMSELQHTKK